MSASNNRRTTRVARWFSLIRLGVAFMGLPSVQPMCHAAKAQRIAGVAQRETKSQSPVPFVSDKLVEI
jgi:hypothetical protein